MTNLKTQEQLRNLMTGIEPIRRTNRRAGESEYYFLRPVAGSEYDDEQIDVPDGVDPIAFRDAGYQVPTTSGTFGAGTGFGTNTGSGFGTSGFGDSTSPYSTTPPTNYGGTYDTFNQNDNNEVNPFGSLQPRQESDIYQCQIPMSNGMCQRNGEYIYCDYPALEEKDAINLIKHNLYQSEGQNIKRPYIDTKGYLTIGPGFLVKTKEDLYTYPLRNSTDNRLLTMAEKDKLWDRYIQAQNTPEKWTMRDGKRIFNVKAGAQSEFDGYTMDSNDIDNIMDKKLEEAYTYAVQSFRNAGFDLNQISSNMLELMVNGTYNSGLGFNQIIGGEKAFEEGDWDFIKRAYKNGDISKERLKFYEELIRREQLYQSANGINRKRR